MAWHQLSARTSEATRSARLGESRRCAHLPEDTPGGVRSGGAPRERGRPAERRDGGQANEALLDAVLLWVFARWSRVERIDVKDCGCTSVCVTVLLLDAMCGHKATWGHERRWAASLAPSVASEPCKVER